MLIYNNGWWSYIKIRNCVRWTISEHPKSSFILNIYRKSKADCVTWLTIILYYFILEGKFWLCAFLICQLFTFEQMRDYNRFKKTNDATLCRAGSLTEILNYGNVPNDKYIFHKRVRDVTTLRLCYRHTHIHVHKHTFHHLKYQIWIKNQNQALRMKNTLNMNECFRTSWWKQLKLTYTFGKSAKWFAD